MITNSELPLPHDTEAEQALLGALLLDNTLLEPALSKGLEPRDFWSPAHRSIFASMAKLFDDGQPLDFITLCDALRSAGNLEAAGGAASVSALIDGSMKLKPENLASHIGIIKQKSQLRLLIKTADDLKRHAEDPGADASTVLTTASNALELVQGSDSGPLQLRPVAEWENQPQPRPILWRDPDPSEGDAWPDCVLSAGEVALLAGAGGLGKSYLSLALAHAATSPQTGASFGAACGLRCATGPVVLVSYEDAPVRVARRLKLIGGGTVPGGVHLWPDPDPLWTANPDYGESRSGPTWAALWREVDKLRPVLVVIDPASAALADVSTSEGGPVRAFLRELAIEAARLDCGVLVIAHDTKAGRNEARAGQDPGAGAVAGSATWFDAARGVLHLVRGSGEGERLAVCIKANHGRTGWGVKLREAWRDGGSFAGLELADRLDRGAVDVELRELRERAERPDSRKHPSEGRCKSLTKGGESCLQDAVVDGLCKQHWRIEKRKDKDKILTDGKRFAGFRESEPSGRKDAAGNTGITENDL